MSEEEHGRFSEGEEQLGGWPRTEQGGALQRGRAWGV